MKMFIFLYEGVGGEGGGVPPGWFILLYVAS